MTKRISVSFPDGTSKEEMERVLSNLWGFEVKMPDEQYQQFISNEKLEIKKIIEPYHSELKAEGNNDKKIAELIDLGKFIYSIEQAKGEKIEIVSCGESPDFIVRFNGELIGIEHTRIIDKEIVVEKSLLEQSIVTAKELVLEKNARITGLYNIFISSSEPLMHHPNYGEMSGEERTAFKDFSKTVASQIANYILSLNNGEPIEKPSFIEKVVRVEAPNFEVNLREEYFLKEITKEKLLASIIDKERKLDSYKRDGVNKYWLFMVLDGVVAKSSFKVSIENLPQDHDSKFDQVIIFDNFSKGIWHGGNSENPTDIL
ncbi:MAG TPA: hypothetical protein VNS32_22745 [Flavisolibacter sp.]|nr:hypothetical protein [Flavisolibacter sp.]